MIAPKTAATAAIIKKTIRKKFMSAKRPVGAGYTSVKLGFPRASGIPKIPLPPSASKTPILFIIAEVLVSIFATCDSFCNVY